MGDAVTVGMSAGTAAGQLSAIFQARSFVVSELHGKFHLGDPGAAGTANPAVETRRVDASAAFGTDPADDGSGTKVQIVSDADLPTLTSAAASETWTHMSFWDDDPGGNFVGSGVLLTPESVTAGQDVTIPAGNVTAKLSNAS